MFRYTKQPSRDCCGCKNDLSMSGCGRTLMVKCVKEGGFDDTDSIVTVSHSLTVQL